MIFEEFNPNIHNTHQVAELVFDVDVRVFRRLFANKNEAVTAIESRLLAEYSKKLLNNSIYKFYVIYKKDNPSKLLGILSISKGKSYNFFGEILFLFKHLKFTHAFNLSTVEFIDRQTLSNIGEDDFYLAEIATVQSERCRGIGKAIIHRVIEEAQNEGFKRVVLDVDLKNNKALKLYESMGFKVYDKRSFKVGNHKKMMYNMEYIIKA